MSLGLVMLVVAMWPDDASRDQRLRYGVLERGATTREIERELQPPSISGRVPPEPRRSTSPPSPKEHVPPEAIEEELPYPDELLAPPAAPMLPIWAYPGVVPSPDGAPTKVPHRFDPGAPRRAVERAVRDEDAKLGLDLPGAGRIASLLATAVRTHTPPVSVGTFEARIASDGEVVGIAVRSFSGGTFSDWETAARRAHAGLDGTVLIMPSHLRGGARVTVRIEQDTEHPSGSGRKPRRKVRPKHEKPSWPYLPKPGRHSWREEPLVSTKDLLPQDLQGLGDPETMMAPCNTDGSGCNYIPGDLADLGTTAARVVRAYIWVAPIIASLIGPRRQLTHADR